MEKPSRVKQVVIWAAILAAFAVSGFAAYYIVTIMTGAGSPISTPAPVTAPDTTRLPAKDSSGVEDSLKK